MNVLDYFKNLAPEYINTPKQTIKSKQIETLGKGHSIPIDAGSDMFTMSRIFDEIYSEEVEEIKKFRKMISFDMIADVIFDICTESFQRFDDGRIFQLKLDDNISEAKRKQYIEKFSEFTDRLDLDNIMKGLVHEFATTSKLYFEKLKKGKKLIGLRILPAESMRRIVSFKTREIKQFQQIIDTKHEPITWEPEEIGYVSFQPVPYLRPSITLYNKLAILDPALVIYRFVRAPERLVFKIYTGRMPRDKAWSYVGQIKDGFKSKLSVSDTGEIDSSKAFHSFLSNYWLPITADDRSSNIESLGGDNSLDDLKDLNIFMKRLYKVLKYPLTRVESVISDSIVSSPFSNRPDSITQDEIKWARFIIEFIQIPICGLMKELFIDELTATKSMEKSGFKDNDVIIDLIDEIDVIARDPNGFFSIKEQEEFEIKMNNYSSVRDYDEFGWLWKFKKVLKFSDEEIDDIIKLKEDKRNDKLAPPVEDDEGAY